MRCCSQSLELRGGGVVMTCSAPPSTPHSTGFVRKPYAGLFRPAIKCFSLSEDFLSPVAFSINSSDRQEPSHWPGRSLSQQLFPAGTLLPGPQIRYEAGRLSLLADEGWRNIDNSLHSLLRNKAGLVRRAPQGFDCVMVICKSSFPVLTHPNSLMCPPPFSWILFFPTNVLKKFLTPHVLVFIPAASTCKQQQDSASVSARISSN